MYNTDPLENNISTIGFYSQIHWNFPIRLVKISASLKEKLTGKSVFRLPRDSGKIQRDHLAGLGVQAPEATENKLIVKRSKSDHMSEQMDCNLTRGM